MYYNGHHTDKNMGKRSSHEAFQFCLETSTQEAILSPFLVTVPVCFAEHLILNDNIRIQTVVSDTGKHHLYQYCFSFFNFQQKVGQIIRKIPKL